MAQGGQRDWGETGMNAYAHPCWVATFAPDAARGWSGPWSWIEAVQAKVGFEGQFGAFGAEPRMQALPSQDAITRAG